MKKVKVLSFTGGSVQGVGLSAIGISILKGGYNPDIIIGESVSAIFGIPLAMGKFGVIEKAMFGFNQKTIFGKQQPLTKDGSKPSLNGIGRALRGKESLGTQDALVDYIRLHFTAEMYAEYLKGDFPTVLIATANYNNGKIEYHNLKELQCYELCLRKILASANIAMLIDSVKLDNAYHYDGGMLSAQSGTSYLKANREKITHWRSVWNRPKIAVFEKEMEQPEWNPKHLLAVTKRTIGLIYGTTSIDSEKDEIYICDKENIYYKSYHLDTEVDNLYATNQDDFRKDWTNGLVIGKT